MVARNPWWGNALRIAGIVLMSLTAALTLMGGAGTACVALNPTGYGGKFAGVAPFQWLYLTFVVVTTAIGAWGARAVVRLINAAKGSYRQALIIQAAGILVGGAHMAASRGLRGGSMPVDLVVYTTVLTLAVFLLFRLPGVWQKLGLEGPASRSKKGSASAMAMAAAGLLALTVQFLMAPTHTFGGINYADVWHTALSLLGAGLTGAGMIAVIRFRLERRSGSIASKGIIAPEG